MHQAGDLAEVLRGRPVRSGHPRTGVREDYDDLIDGTELEVKPSGRQHNRFHGPDLEDIAERLMSRDLFSTGTEAGLSAEFPYTSPVPGLVALAMGLPRSGATAMMQMLAQAHPGYGNGLLTLLYLPERATPRVALRRANDLNLAELSGQVGVPSWGAWTSHPQDSALTVHTAFLPNTFALPGLAGAVANYTYMRSQWAQERLVPAATVAAVRAGRTR
jgi:hypothetical protein